MRLPVWASLLVGPLVAVAGVTSTGAAQFVVAVRVGVLRGVVRDTIQRAGLSYALVTAVGAERRVFANAAGAFAITGLSTGPELVRVQQIGYAAVEVPIVLVDPATDSTGVERLEIVLGQRVYVLPELTVVATGGLRSYQQPLNCPDPPGAVTGAAAQLVIDQAVTNADRILTLEVDYPFEVTFEHIRQAEDTAGRAVDQWVDTVTVNPRNRPVYRPGKVLPRRVRGASQEAYYFTVADLARDAFQKAHCVRYVGGDSAEGRRVHRVDFEPAPHIKTADWAGRLSFDAESFVLVRSDAWLVKVNPKRNQLRAARCAVNYRAEIPTLVHENVALCLAEQKDRRYPTSREIYRVIGTKFLGVRPGEQR